MKILLAAIVILACLLSVGAAAESPYIFGWHFWRDGANIDAGGGGGGGRPGWVTTLEVSTDYQPDMDKYRRIANEGHTIIFRLDWDSMSTFPPPSSANYETMAARYAFWVYKLKDYCRIWLIGNEEWVNADCFRAVRKAIHAVQPEAIVAPGAPHDPRGTVVQLGDYIDGFAAHTNDPGFIGEVTSANPRGKTLPCYITEFHGAPPNPPSQFRADYGAFAQWNATNAHKLECATNFVYYEFGSEYSSIQMQPMQNADYCEAAAFAYANSYALPFLAITNIAAIGTGQSTASVTWDTDHAATGQVEFWEEGARTQQWSQFYNTASLGHSAEIGGLIPGRSYEYVVKSYADGRPFTVSKVSSFVHQPPNTGTVSGTVRTHAGLPVHGASVTRNPGALVFSTDENGEFNIAGCPAGEISLTVASPNINGVTRTEIQVVAGQTTSVNIATTPRVNYVSNPSFEMGSSGWTYFGSGPQIVSPSNGPYPWFGDIVAHTGTYFLGRAANWDQPKGGAWQRVTGLAPGSYRFSVFAQLYVLDHPYYETKHRVGIDPTGGSNPLSTNVQWSAWDTNFWLAQSEWKQLLSPQVTVNSGACTVYVQYEDTCMQGWHLHAYDDAALTGSALELQDASGPAQAKSFEDGTPVQMFGAIATTARGELGTDIIYLEDSDRVSGIRVDLNGLPGAVTEGSVVAIAGTTATTAGGERYIEATNFTPGSGTPLEPLGVTHRELGGGDNGYDPGPPAIGQQGVTGGQGLNNVGLLVRTTGAVVSSGAGYVMLSDGSPSPIKVNTSALSSPPAGHIAITGVVSLEDSGGGPAAVLLPRKDADVRSVY